MPSLFAPRTLRSAPRDADHFAIAFCGNRICHYISMNPHPTPRAALFAAVALFQFLALVSASAQNGNASLGGANNIFLPGAFNSINAGGFGNTNGGINGAIAGGSLSAIFDVRQGFIGGANTGTLQSGANSAALIGGFGNTILSNSLHAVIVGGIAHRVGAINGTVLGGDSHVLPASAINSSIVGGFANTNAATNSAIVASTVSAIAAGVRQSFIAGANQGTIQSGANVAAIVGGFSNFVGADSARAFIGGGQFNEVRAPGGAVVGGFANEAAGTNSFAAGSQAVASNTGTFVWADSSTNTDFISTSNNQFLIRATGGVGINTNNPGTNALLVRGRAQIVGDLQVTGQVNGNLSASNATLNTLSASNSFSIQTGGTLAWFASSLGTNASPSFPGVNWSSRNIIAGHPSNSVASAVIGATIGGGGGVEVGATNGFNRVSGNFGTIAGGYGNSVSGEFAFIGGGDQNFVTDRYAAIIAGFNNQATAPFAFVGAGDRNAAGGEYAIVSGGRQNAANSSYAAVGSGFANTNAGAYGVVAGGQSNTISALGTNAVVSGGSANKATNIFAVVGGGGTNTAGGPYSTVAGGYFNQATGFVSAIGGGQDNRATNVGSTVAGGALNQANGEYATVGGGLSNTAGYLATVPGGQSNQATGTGSFAAGVRAKATDNYSFVWGGDPTVDTTSYGQGTYTARAPQGARFITSSSTNLTTTNTNPPVGVYLAAGATAWNTLSDSNAKTAVTAIDHRETLRKLAALPVTAWSYKHDPNRRYIGPMAQDFHATFGLGHDEKHISTIDTDGVTLSAIKGLAQELEEQNALLAEREAKLHLLEEKLHELQRRLPPASGESF
jgi:hypothetical protein